MDSNHQKLPAMMMMPTLPVDVIVDILCRLPVKTLLRFRCVSKQFRTMIDDPDFVKRHLQFHSSEQRLIVQGQYSEHSVDNAFNPQLPFKGWRRVIVIGSCDGLLALLDVFRDSIFLWNISTRKCHLLPPCPGVDCFPNPSHIHGFGRDAATDNYKLVKISNFYDYDVTQVNVYSLNANYWTRIDGSPPYSRYYLADFPNISALVEGALNWLVDVQEDEDNRKDLIVSFDLKNEIFFELSLPDTIGRNSQYKSNLMVLGGCLGVISSYGYERVYDVWVMKEYGLKYSWTKLFSFSRDDNPPILCYPRVYLLPNGNPPISPYPRVFLSSMHEDKIFILEDCGEVFRYDMEEKKFEIVKINKLQKCITSVSNYVESLVSPYGKHYYMQKGKWENTLKRR